MQTRTVLMLYGEQGQLPDRRAQWNYRPMTNVIVCPQPMYTHRHSTDDKQTSQPVPARQWSREVHTVNINPTSLIWTLSIRVVGWCLTALSAQTGYIIINTQKHTKKKPRIREKRRNLTLRTCSPHGDLPPQHRLHVCSSALLGPIGGLPFFSFTTKGF